MSEPLRSGPRSFDYGSDEFVLSAVSTPTGSHLVSLLFCPGRNPHFEVHLLALDGTLRVDRTNYLEDALRRRASWLNLS